MDNVGAIFAGTFCAFALLLIAPLAAPAVSRFFKLLQSFL